MFFLFSLSTSCFGAGKNPGDPSQKKTRLIHQFPARVNMAKVGPEITNQFEPCRAQHTQTDDDNKLPVQGSAVVTFFFDTLIFGKQN